MNWRDTQKPLIRVKSNWRNTMTKTPKEFDVNEHKPVIQSLIKSEVASLKQSLKAQIDNHVKAIKPAKDGRDSAQWHTDLDSGNDGDFAFVDGEFYQKKDGEWTFLFSAKSKKNVMVTGGVSETFVTDAINTAIADIPGGGGGPATEVIVVKSDNWTITNETHVSFLVSSEKTATFPSQTDQTVTIKNSVNSTANIIVSGASFDGQSDWTIRPGSAFRFVPIGGTSYDVI